MIASGGSGNDSSIKLWTKQANDWSCIQTINDHNGCITDLQLSKNQEYLFSASEDETIKIWKMKSSNNQLECIQTLEDHNNCVLWITISHDSLFMASSNYENYFNIYKNEQNLTDPWKQLNKIDTKGKIHRLYFTKNDELLVQQENPPLLIVYQKNQNNQYLATQDVLLNQPDNNDLLFPIFQLDSTVYLKNNKFVYVIRRLNTGKYLFNKFWQHGVLVAAEIVMEDQFFGILMNCQNKYQYQKFHQLSQLIFFLSYNLNLQKKIRQQSQKQKQ